MKILNYIKVLSIIILFIASLIIIYAYNSGSCQINKEYICEDNFCLIKEFNIELNQAILNDIDTMLDNKTLQKRVSITTYPENILIVRYQIEKV